MKINFLFSQSDRKSINLDVLFHAGQGSEGSRESGYSCSHWRAHILYLAALTASEKWVEGYQAGEASAERTKSV